MMEEDMTHAVVIEPNEPIERAVQIIFLDDDKSVGKPCISNTFQDEILKIELNHEERRLFETLRKAAIAWEEDKLSIDPKSVQIRIAGGWVRDKILGLQTHDVDIALDTCTGVEFATVVKEYHSSVAQAGNAKANNGKDGVGKIGVIAANPAQSKHLETATVRIFGNDVDFSNLRHETYADDSRIPNTVMGTPLEDSFRRDCTMNALYYNLNTESIEDWTRRGLQDLLKTKVVHTPLKAFQTFKDDPLRVLRLIRFAVRYQMELSEEVQDACRLPQIHNELRRKVSRERVGNELEGMLSGKHANPIEAMGLICRLDLADCVFPLPSGIDITGSIGQMRLDAVPYMRAGMEECEAISLRTAAWNEAHDCLQSLPTVLGIFLAYGKQGTALDRRLVYLAVIMLPFMKLSYLEKQKTKSVIEYMMRDGIKFKNKDVISLGLIAQNLEDTIRLLEQQQAYSSDKTVIASPSRLQAGLLLRSTKEMWVTTLVVATIFLCRRQGTSTECAQEWRLCAKDLYECIVSQMKLDECWKSKPLMNGKDLIRVLELGRGPEVGVYMQEQVQWILTNPSGSIDELHEYLKRFKASREAGADEAEEPVLKKMHIA